MHDSDFEGEEKSQSELCIVVDSISEPTSSGIVKITTPSGSIFLLRDFYLDKVKIEDLRVGSKIEDDYPLEILDSTLCCVVEGAALQYLNRSEHSRFLLEQKLKKKEYGNNQIQKALDYLESENLLSDRRYAISWLRTRRLSKTEGRTKLFSELISRGVCKKDAQDALDEFFSEFSEDEMLFKAYEKLKKKNLSEEKLIASLLRRGFSSSMIKKIL